MGVIAENIETWYRVFDKLIEPVSVVKSTDASVWLLKSAGYGRDQVRIERRHSSYLVYTPDFEEAKALVVAKLKAELSRYTRQLEQLPHTIQATAAHINRVKALTPPSSKAAGKPITAEEL